MWIHIRTVIQTDISIYWMHVRQTDINARESVDTDDRSGRANSRKE